MRSVAVRVRGVRGTHALARVLAPALPPGCWLLLQGDLGVGKTAFVQGLLRALPGGDRLRARSPSYALCHAYPTLPRLWHVDLFRLEQSARIDALGLFENVEPVDLIAIEWAERLGHVPLPSLRLRFTALGLCTREIDISSAPAGAALVQAYADRIRGAGIALSIC